MKNEKNLFYQLANLTNECVIGCDFVQDRFLFVPEDLDLAQIYIVW